MGTLRILIFFPFAFLFFIIIALLVLTTFFLRKICDFCIDKATDIFNFLNGKCENCNKKVLNLMARIFKLLDKIIDLND